MSDIALIWNENIGAADFNVVGNDLEPDDSLETAVMLSLFTDRRAADDDVLPFGESDRRGWWGDNFPSVPGDLIGSRLWLLSRSKQTQDVVDRAKDYAKEALQWLIDDRICEQIDVESAIVGNGILGIGITIFRPQVDPVTFRYDYLWKAQQAKRAG